MQKPERSVYTAQDFMEWRAAGTLDLTPKFQRRGVWTSAARSFFIDSLLRMMPVPPLYIRIVQAPDHSKAIRQIIDGQQRVSTVLAFTSGEFRLSSTLPGPWAGKTFNSLSKTEKDCITGYTFSSEQFQGINDAEVLAIFERLNTYSVPLNAQELRNGKYFGLFKQSAYGLAREHLEFWRSNKIFSERSLARMSEVELTSELLIAQIGGMQDKKKSVDTYYGKLDESFPTRLREEKRFRNVIDTITETLPHGFSDTNFSRVPLFYSLFCAVYHRQHGLRGVSLSTPKRDLSKTERLSLAQTAKRASELIDAVKAGDTIPKPAETFVNACLRQTDNLTPRNERLKYLYNSAFGK